jgi:hypothetical protein
MTDEIYQIIICPSRGGEARRAHHLDRVREAKGLSDRLDRQNARSRRRDRQAHRTRHQAVQLEPIREKLARAGLVCIPRQEGDQRQIVESWI